MPTIDVNNTSLYYERTGEGPAILFIHGMCGHADVWADQAERLSDRYTCVRYDRRGHTRSARGRAAISTAVHADDAVALIEVLELAPCLLVSLSGGAVIGVDVAMRHGDRLRGAVFSEPPLFSLDDQARDAAMADLGPIVGQAASGDLRSAVDAFFSLMCPGLWSRIDDSRKDSYRANAEIGFTDVGSQTLEVTPAELAAVSVPARSSPGTPAARRCARSPVASPPGCQTPASSNWRTAGMSPTPSSLRPSPELYRRSPPSSTGGLPSPIGQVSQDLRDEPSGVPRRPSRAVAALGADEYDGRSGSAHRALDLPASRITPRRRP